MLLMLECDPFISIIHIIHADFESSLHDNVDGRKYPIENIRFLNCNTINVTFMMYVTLQESGYCVKSVWSNYDPQDNGKAKTLVIHVQSYLPVTNLSVYLILVFLSIYSSNFIYELRINTLFSFFGVSIFDNTYNVGVSILKCIVQ